VGLRPLAHAYILRLGQREGLRAPMSVGEKGLSEANPWGLDVGDEAPNRSADRHGLSHQGRAELRDQIVSW